MKLEFDHNVHVPSANEFVAVDSLRLLGSDNGTRCSYCGAMHTSDSNGQICSICQISKVGEEVLGVQFYDENQ